MTGNNIIKYSFAFLAYLFVQVFILKDVVLFGYSFGLLYVFFLLTLPLEVGTVPLLLLGFGMGMAVDVFYDSLGINASATVLLAFARNPWIKANTPRGGYDDYIPPTLHNMGLGWFTIYALPLISAHHFLFFYIDSLGTDFYLLIVSKALSSVLFTFVLGVVVQLLFYKKKKGV
ncbi:rod shape-determining protein MreD [Pleomorphovibrio marinus]|uniref:rod shape-determining protein MreD n=1 Tax=Pleomorphovibrio marinus TaxID=2164132 RepID=UPI000E0B5AA6|nr:rod shape-determining protein MreD [Pleomorphovibrio marinus]